MTWLVLVWMSFASSGPSLRPPAAAVVRDTEQVGPAGDSIEAAIADLGRATALAGFDASLRRACEPLLAEAGEARAAGRVSLALARLWSCWQDAGAERYRLSKAGVAAGGPPAFLAEWTRLGGELAGRARDLDARRPGAAPLVTLALFESAAGVVDAYYRAGRLYGEQTTVDDGLFYLGRAVAATEFAALVARVAVPAPEPPPPLDAVPAALRALDADLVRAARALGDGDGPTRIAPVNAVAKLAADLESQGRRAGALREYLRATTELTLRTADAPVDRAALVRARDEWRARLTTGGVDHSLARFFWDEADWALALPAGAPDLAPRLRRAAAILDVTLPRYRAIVEGQVAAPAVPAASGRVVVTLVRWPYT